jgi:hypothetical protein
MKLFGGQDPLERMAHDAMEALVNLLFGPEEVL